MSRREPRMNEENKDASGAFWRSLEEQAGADSLHTAAAELPFGLTDQPVGFLSSHELNARFLPDTDPRLEGVGPSVSRRGFFKFGTAVTALFGLEACVRRPVEKLVPYTRAPEYAIPGVSSHFATVYSRRGEALGLVVESHEGRPTKVEGNPDHPASLGSTDIAAQAAIFDLYDPDRSKKPSFLGVVKASDSREGSRTAAEYEEFLATFDKLMKGHEADRGAKLRILMEPSNSPTVLRLRSEAKSRFPDAQFHIYSPTGDLNAQKGTAIAFGKAMNPIYDFARARVVVSLESDFLQTEPGSVRWARSFAEGRRLRSSKDSMNRLYVVESAYSTTGANADHRLRLPSRDIDRYARLLAKELAAKGLDLSGVASGIGNPSAESIPENWIREVAADLLKNKEHAVIVVGTGHTPALHALASALNAALGSQVVQYASAADEQAVGLPGLHPLVKEMEAGKVETLVILGGNPVYTAPADLKFKEALINVKTSVHLSSHLDETSLVCHWHVPRAHEFEAWGDARSLDGSWAIQQPMIAPLHGAKSDIELLGHVLGPSADGKFRTGSGYDFVRETVHAATAEPFEHVWKTALKNGYVSKGMLESIASVRGAEIASELLKTPKGKGAALEVTFYVDPKVQDGRQANNAWLQELPDPLTRIVWDNAALVSPKTAKELGLASGDVVELSAAHGKVEASVWVQPGQADGSIALSLGWGRNIGRYATAPDAPADPLHIYPVATGRGRGANAYLLRTSDSMSFVDGISLKKTGQSHALVQTQEHHSMEGRAIAIYETADHYRERPNFPEYKVGHPKTLPLWKPQDYTQGHKWGLNIDLTTCTGCNACVIACQAENNIPVVGRDQVRRGREMHWVRIDRYFIGDESDPKVATQPVGCQQCEQAPCENVCPVNATTHSPEGLNDMAYNRCIGTRYCANNCPYKVRRFNYLEFQGDPMYGDLPETVKMQFNPNVTVRMRGVIEKCTYCVQRIQEAKIHSRRTNKPLSDGDFTTACAQACPSQAISFGDLNDPTSRVSEAAKRDRSYDLLADVGTHPRTSYLGKILNPNPAMKDTSYSTIFPVADEGKEHHG